jgi:asparagine synthase (glutamine-hydrolysing)
MLISSFSGVISTSPNIEFAPKDKEPLRFNQQCEVGGYFLTLEGQCPGANARDCGILLDGTIFNTAELAGRLDTELLDGEELLLRAYRKWGVGFPRYLEGEFAFVLWDRTTAQILLGCGPGVSFPLFYAQHGKDFFFARSLRHLLTKIDTVPSINEDYLARWLALTAVGSDSTFFEDVFRVMPGSILIFERGHIKHEAYWQPEKTSPLHLRESREYADGLREVLTRAIQDRLPKPGGSAVGTQLSGGLDSSSVTSLTAEILLRENRRLYAFTAIPEHSVDNPAGRFCDEGPNAATVAAMWPNVDHLLIRHGHHSVFRLMDLFGAEQLEPIINPANYDWTYEICLQARQRELNTLLVGDSGNMTFSYANRLALCSIASEGRFMTLAKLAWEMHHNGGRGWSAIGYEMLNPLIPLNVRCLLNKTRGNFKSLFEYSMIQPEFARHHGLDAMALERNINYSHSRPLRALYLRRPDVGVVNEAFQQLTGVLRLDPAADRRVVEFCLSVPVEYYCEKGVPRSLIRNAMIGRLPEQVRTERRKGLQAADFNNHFEREEALAELARMKKVDLAVRTLDLEKLEQMLFWSSDQIAKYGGMPQYWATILRAFSLGRFLRRFEDGTLFTPPFEPLSDEGS